MSLQIWIAISNVSFYLFQTVFEIRICCPASIIGRVVKGKIVHFVNKVSNVAQTTGINRFKLEVVYKFSAPRDDVIMISSV